MCVGVFMYSSNSCAHVHCLCSCRKQQTHNTLSTCIRAFDSLLSLATVISEALRATTVARPTHRLSRRESHFEVSQRIDSKSAIALCTTAIHLVKQNLFWKEDEADIPHLNGCDRFDTHEHVARAYVCFGVCMLIRFILHALS